MKHFAKLIFAIAIALIAVTTFARYGSLTKPTINHSFTDPTVREAVKAWVIKNSCGKPNDVDQMLNLVEVNSKEKHLNPFLVLGLIRQESCFNTRARSNMNALGYMQVIPKWHPEKVRGRSLYNPTVGIEVGTQVMREYIDRYGEAKGLQVYSGGARSYYNGVLKFKNSLVMYTDVYVLNNSPKSYSDTQLATIQKQDHLDEIGKIIARANIKSVNSIIVANNSKDTELLALFK